MQGYPEPPDGEESDYGSDWSPSEEDALIELLSKAADDAKGPLSVNIDGAEDDRGFQRSRGLRAIEVKPRDKVQYAELSTAPSQKQAHDLAVEIDGHRRDESTSTSFRHSPKNSLTDWQALS